MRTPAPCGNCGSTVMTYRRYFLYTKPTATCESCGRLVRHRGYWALLAVAVVLLVIFFAALAVLSSAMTQAGVGALLAVVGLVLDRWSWMAVPWDPVVPSGD